MAIVATVNPLKPRFGKILAVQSWLRAIGVVQVLEELLELLVWFVLQ